MLLTVGQVIFPLVLRFSPTFNERYKRNILLRETINNLFFFLPIFYFQDNLKRKAEYQAYCDNNDNPKTKRQKAGISANEQLNTLVTERFKIMLTKEDQCFIYSKDSFKIVRTL